MQKKNFINLAVLVIVAGGMFYGGMIYGTNKAGRTKLQIGQEQGRGDGIALGVGGGQGRIQRPGGGNNVNGGFSNGQILSKDDTSITIKNREGGSKVIYYSDATTVGKTVSGAISDLAVGQDVLVTGKGGTDGAFVAENIQIRPDQPDSRE
jgi:hypothetical protein